MAELSALFTIVHGRVQGVCFRAFVTDIARSLDLTGYVRNLPGERDVEVYAEGERERLEGLLRQLKSGPPEARVERTETRWSDYSGSYSQFNITR